MSTVRVGTHSLVLQAEWGDRRVALKLPRLIHDEREPNRLAAATMGAEVERLNRLWKTSRGMGGLAPFLAPATLERSRPGVGEILACLFGPVDSSVVENVPAALFIWADGSIADAAAGSDPRGWTAREYILLARTLATGLAALHEHGALHGDVRLENVMFAGDGSDPRSYFLTEYSAELPSEPSSTLRTERRRDRMRFPPEARYALSAGPCRLHELSAGTDAETGLFLADADAPPTADELDEARQRLERAEGDEAGPRLSLELRDRLIEVRHAVSLPRGVAIRCWKAFGRRIPPYYAVFDEASAAGAATIRGQAQWRMKRSERGDLYGLGSSLLQLLGRTRPGWRRDCSFAGLAQVIVRCFAAGMVEPGHGRWAVPVYRNDHFCSAAEIATLCGSLAGYRTAMEIAGPGFRHVLP